MLRELVVIGTFLMNIPNLERLNKTYSTFLLYNTILFVAINKICLNY